VGHTVRGRDDVNVGGKAGAKASGRDANQEGWQGRVSMGCACRKDNIWVGGHDCVHGMGKQEGQHVGEDGH